MKTGFVRTARFAALALVLALPACGGDTSGGGPNPTPGIISLSPAQVVAGSPDLEVVVTGSDFVRQSVVRFNGTDVSTTFRSSTQVAATIPAAMLAVSGQASVQVFNPAPGGGASNTMGFAVTIRVNPVPAVTTLAPAAVDAGGPAATVTVNGTGFVPESKVYLGQTQQATEYVSPTQLRATFTAAQLAAAGTLQLSVVSPFPGGGQSNLVAFTVRAPVPVISSLGQTQTTAGQTSYELTVNGTGFVANSEVRFNGAGRPTLLVSPTQLKVTLASQDLAAAGTYQITVVNPTPGGGTSNVASLTLVNGTPSITLLPSYAAAAGRTGFTLMVHGTGFVNGTVVRWNGADRPTSYINATRVSANIPFADVAAAGSVQITVFNPAPGGGTSGSKTFTIRALAPAAITSIRTLDVPAQDVAYSAATGRLYVSFPGTSPRFANSVAAVDPLTGVVADSAFVGSEPGVLALSRDASLLYVALDGSQSVRRVVPATLTPGLEFSIGARVEEMETMPGNASAVAISLMSTATSPRHLGVCLYDDGIKRSRCTQGHTGSNSIEFGETGSALYGYNNESTEFGFRTISVLADGLQEQQVSGSLIQAFYTRIHYASGRVYSDNGVVVDAERHVKVGALSTGFGSFALADPQLGRVFSMDAGTITAFDMNTFTSLGSITLPEYTDDHPALRRVRMVRWGTDGLAITDGHRLYIVRTTLAAP